MLCFTNHVYVFLFLPLKLYIWLWIWDLLYIHQGFLEACNTNYLNYYCYYHYYNYHYYGWRSSNRSALSCEWPWIGSWIRIREKIQANFCTIRGPENWGNWSSRVWWSSAWHKRFFVDKWSAGSYVVEIFFRSRLCHSTTVFINTNLPRIVKS